MSAGFWEGYVGKLLVVALLLAAVYAAGAKLRRRGFLGGPTRCIRVIEAAVLSQHAAIYVVAVAGRYFLLGAGNGGVARLAELAAEAVETSRPKSRNI
jgi:flagellar biogenesis protein FliO